MAKEHFVDTEIASRVGSIKIYRLGLMLYRVTFRARKNDITFSLLRPKM